MKDRGVSNTEVAEAAAVDPVTVSQWRGDRQAPSDEALVRVAAFLGTSVAFLRYGPDTRSGSAADLARRNPDGSVTTFEVKSTAPRHARNLPLSVREYLAEFQLRLTKGGASEDDVDEAMTLLRSPQVFIYFSGGKLNEYNETDILDGMKSIAEDVVIPRLRKLGRKL
jgi:transcriptional regulator with XRE-family HTH domain